MPCTAKWKAPIWHWIEIIVTNAFQIHQITADFYSKQIINWEQWISAPITSGEWQIHYHQLRCIIYLLFLPFEQAILMQLKFRELRNFQNIITLHLRGKNGRKEKVAVVDNYCQSILLPFSTIINISSFCQVMSQKPLELLNRTNAK